MNSKNSEVVNFVETVIYLLLYDLHDCTFKKPDTFFPIAKEVRDHDVTVKKNFFLRNTKILVPLER